MKYRIRIISGQYKGRALKLEKQDQTRPTKHAVRETAFQLLHHHFPPANRVLDLFCGTGAYGFEALSQGASEAFFIDYCFSSVHAIHETAKAWNIEQKVRTLCREWPVKPMNFKNDFFADWVFIDPPYAYTLPELEIVLEGLKGWIHSETVVVLETPLQNASFQSYRSVLERKSMGVFLKFLVPGAGIEPATQGFSVLCSTN
jgi:16S rRNA (guanine966-N2)-methyltransferase